MRNLALHARSDANCAKLQTSSHGVTMKTAGEIICELYDESCYLLLQGCFTNALGCPVLGSSAIILLLYPPRLQLGNSLSR